MSCARQLLERVSQATRTLSCAAEAGDLDGLERALAQRESALAKLRELASAREADADTLERLREVMSLDRGVREILTSARAEVARELERTREARCVASRLAGRRRTARFLSERI